MLRRNNAPPDDILREIYMLVQIISVLYIFLYYAQKQCICTVQTWATEHTINIVILYYNLKFWKSTNFEFRYE
jgi:hypothetical protein